MCPQLQIYNRNPIIINFLINPIIFRFVVVSGFSNSKKILKKKKKKKERNRALEKTYIPFLMNRARFVDKYFAPQLSMDVAHFNCL